MPAKWSLGTEAKPGRDVRSGAAGDDSQSFAIPSSADLLLPALRLGVNMDWGLNSERKPATPEVDTYSVITAYSLFVLLNG